MLKDSLLALVIVLASLMNATAAERRIDTTDKPGNRVNLVTARRLALEREAGGDVQFIGPIGVEGFNFAREVDLGKGLRAFVISCNLGGGLILFDRSGEQIAAFRTWEVNYYQLFDFDDDGIFEIITEQRDGVGTGIAFWNFHIYSVSSHKIQETWEGESYYFDGNSRRLPIVRQGFIRCVPSNIEYPAPHLIHLSTDSIGRWLAERAFVLRGKSFVAVHLRPAA